MHIEQAQARIVHGDRREKCYVETDMRKKKTLPRGVLMNT